MKLGTLALALCLPLSACARPTTPAADSHVMSFAEFSAGQGLAESPACDPACQSLRQEFAYVAYVGKQVYEYWDEKKADTGTDFDALAGQLSAKIVSGMSSTAYWQLLRQWAGAFHDGHVNAMLSDDKSPFEIYTAPVRFELLAPGTPAEALIVAKTAPGAGLSVGQQVLAVNGVPALAAVTAAVPWVSGSTVGMRRGSAARRLPDAYGTADGALDLAITVQSGGAPLTVTVPRAVEIDLPPDPAAPPAADATGADLIKASILPGGLGYLRIDGFSGSKDQELLAAAMARLIGTKGLILDLRANGGGDLSGDVVLARLVSKAITRYRISVRVSDYTLSQRPQYFYLPTTAGQPYTDWHDLTVEAAAAAEQYGAAKPVVALISGNCFSACDTFSAALKANGLATFLGEPTGGGTGTPLVFGLPVSKLQFRYGVVRGHTAHDEVIEGHGTLPDVVVTATAADRASGQDTQLAAAISTLEQKLRGAPQSAADNAAAQSSAAAAVRTFGAVWDQSLARSPSLTDDAALARLAPKDELSQN